MSDSIFFDENGPISPEEAFKRFQIISEREADVAIQSMGFEYFEELHQFLEDFSITHPQELSSCVAAIMVSSAVGSLPDIIDTILSAMSVGAISYREKLLKHNPILADQIDAEIHQEANLIREAKEKGYGTDEAAD